MEKIKEWLKNNNGSGYGSGSGWGDGSGYGSGSGWGDGSGSGSGWGDGSGSGSGSGWGDGYGSGWGDGYGLKSVNFKEIHMIDGIQTVIISIKLNLAKGYIVESDLTLTPCYIAKGNGYFAHGRTVKEAQDALREKIYGNMDTDEAIDKFLETFEDGKSYPGKDFFEWHHYLTGSCLMGRESFVKNNNLSVDNSYTVSEFIEICENAYGGDVIRQLKERWTEIYDQVQDS